MKRFTTTWTLVLMAVLSFSLMSCQDDDERLAYYLDGVWQGTITDDEQSYSTTIQFFQDSYYSAQGEGFEKSTGWSYGHTTRTHFTWWVQNRTIYLQYSGSRRYIVMECNWLPGTSSLGEELIGRFLDYDTGYDMADFYLRKVYNNDYYYYAKENTHTEAEK